MNFYHPFCITFAFSKHLSWLGFLSGGITQTFIPKGYGILLALCGLWYYHFSLTLTQDMVMLREALRISCIPDILSLTSCVKQQFSFPFTVTINCLSWHSSLLWLLIQRHEESKGLGWQFELSVQWNHCFVSWSKYLLWY